MIEEKAYAKVNLFLNVVDKRSDGYHNLEMINAKIDLFDTLKFKIIDCPDTVIIKSNDMFLSNQDNIVIQVAKHLLKEYNIRKGLEIYIDKHIPFGAGLAGNSSDSAAVIKGINKIFELNLSSETMEEIGLMFGADIPYCLHDEVAIVEGIGEKITPIKTNLSAFKVLLINPKEYISTKEIFKLINKNNIQQKSIKDLVDCLKNGKPEGLKIKLFNSLENIVVNNYKNMAEFRKDLVDQLGEEGLIMTGSGSSFIKIIDEKTSINDFITKNKTKYLTNVYNFL